MRATRIVGILFCMAMVVATFGSSVKAEEFDKLTIFTFSEPVELPGNVVLSSGTYVFKLVDTAGTRNAVQVFDQEQTELYATILTISAERLRPTDNTTLAFYTAIASSPNALKTWFYPGDSNGQEFVYPRARAAELAKTSKQPATILSSNLTS